MKRILLQSIWLLLASALMLPAAGPDDQYIALYRLIQDADQMARSGQSEAAREKYLEAQSGLQKLKSSFPKWNENVVEFRLRYVTEKLGSALVPKEPAPIPVKPATTPGKTTAQAEAEPSGAASERIRALTDEVQRLQASNAILDAKLKEALALRPGAVDPRELATAEERIKLLEKEKELLRVTLESERAKPRAGSLENLEKKLAEANASLSRQKEIAVALTREKEILEARLEIARKDSETVQTLRVENQSLRKQLAEIKPGSAIPSTTVVPSITTLPATPLPATPVVDQASAATIDRLQTALNSLQAEKSALEKVKLDLEAKLAGSAQNSTRSNAGESERIRLLEGEKDELLKKLNETTRQLYENQTRTKQVQRDRDEGQLENLRARLAVLEANKVPYTPEELALFKQPALSVEKPESKASKQAPRTWPKGAEPLLAEAERAFASNRFDEAEKKFREMLRFDENNVLTLGNLAASQLEQNREAEAEANLNKALAQDPTDAYSLSLLGILKFRQQKLDEALDFLSRSARLDPQNPKTQNYLGITLSQKGQRGAAESALRRAIQLAPGYGNAHHNLAVIYATQKPPFTELARWHYQKALASGHPQNPELEKLIESGRTSANLK